MYDVDAIAAHDREVVADIRRRQALINDNGHAAGHRIRDVRLYRVMMPWTGTKRWDGSAETFSFAEFETDQGLVGIAEGVSADSTEELKGRVLDRNPFDPEIRADLGLAYWDFVGKIAGQPLYRTLRDVFELDTPVVDRVPMAAYTWYRFPDPDGRHEVTFDSYPEHLQQIIEEHGFRVIKLSMCDFEPPRYVELIHNIRQALGPEVILRVDPHASWSESQALSFMRRVEPYDLEWIEEPVGGSFENIYRAGHRLRLMSTVPISSHAWLPPVRKELVPPAPDSRGYGRYSDSTLNAPLDLDAIRRFVPADISAPDAYEGPLALKRLYDTALFMGLELGMHSAYELGPATVIRLHTAAFAFPYELPYHIAWGRPVAPFALHALDAHYNQWEGDVIRGGKLKYDQGFLKIPEGPGLGVELDPDLLKHYELTEEKMAPHHRHIEAIRERHLDALGWQQSRTGWPRYRD